MLRSQSAGNSDCLNDPENFTVTLGIDPLRLNGVGTAQRNGSECLGQSGGRWVGRVGDGCAADVVPAAREPEHALLDSVGVDSDGDRVDAQNLRGSTTE